MMMLAVTGAASLMMSVTGRRDAYDRPSDWCTTMFLRKSPYWTYTGRSSPTSFRTRSTWSGGHCAPQIRRAGSAGTRKKMMYDTMVTATNSTPAQSSRLTRYLNISLQTGETRHKGQGWR